MPRKVTKLLCLLGLLVLLGGCGSHQAQSEPEETPAAHETPAAEGHETPAEGHGKEAKLSPWEQASRNAQEALNQRELEQAEQLCMEALALAREPEQNSHLVTSLHNLGKVRIAQNRLDEGIELFEEAIRLEQAKPHPDRAMLAACWNKLGAARYAANRNEEAIDAIKRGLDVLKEETFYRGQRGEMLSNLTKLYQATGRKTDMEAVQERLRRLRIPDAAPPEKGTACAWWLARAYPEPLYRRAGTRYRGRQVPPDRRMAVTRFLGRSWPSAEPEKKAEGH
ncbi:MAG: tetratricopeptide repeat protein [Candidatus Eremiobacteraeota bacterium]|nr:tetratricopeptide repeat protein [Candidatus Eremiobacteraeota bacterium]